MKLDRRHFLAGSAAAAASIAAPNVLRAQAGPIKIGEINSYTAQPAFLNPYRNGWTLALEQVNAKGGVLGRKIETIHRDDGGKPEDSVRHALRDALDTLPQLEDDDFLLSKQVNFETIHVHDVVAERFGTVGELRGELATGRPTSEQTTLAAWLNG